jgi:hypothetical protein
LKKGFRKGFHICASHIEEVVGDKVESLEYHLVLRYFEYVFEEVLGIPPKRDNDFSLYLVLGVSPVFKTPYKMGTLELKELQIQLE